MIVSAIYFKDEDCSHIKVVKFCSSIPDHYLVNGNVAVPNDNSWKPDDIIVKGKVTSFKAAVKRTEISHYSNRENGETMSVATYNAAIDSFRNSDGSYKDLDNEYLCRKMKQTYVPIHRTFYDYEDAVFTYEETELHPDDYCVCDGRIVSDDKTLNDPKNYFFVFKLNKWKFCNDTIKRLMEEYGVQRVNKKEEATSKEYYILYDQSHEYKWLEFCGAEFFRTHNDVFQSEAKGKEPIYIYGTYKECLSIEKNIEARFRDMIESQLDKMRTVNIKKSDLKKLYGKLEELVKSVLDDTKKDTHRKVRTFIHDFADISQVEEIKKSVWKY